METEGTTGDAALLIDWENLKFSLDHKGVRPNVSALRDTAERFGRVVVARAYADWTDGWHRPDPSNLYAAAIEPIYVPTRSYWDEDASSEKRKNSVDVKLTADCIELCHQHANIRVFVLVTGDQDFLHVVNALRPHGKSVVIIGVSWTTSARLAERVDAVIYYDKEVDRLPPAEVEVAPASDAIDDVTWAAAELAKLLTLPDDLEPKLASVVSHITTIVREHRSQHQPLLLSGLGNELSKRMPAQEFAMIVKGRLKQIAMSLDTQGLLKVVNQGLADWIYLPDEDVPEPAVDDPHTLPGYWIRERFVELGLIDRREVVEAIRHARLQPGVTYLTFNRIVDVLRSCAAGKRMGGDTQPLVKGMVDDNVLVRGEEKEWFDVPTGRTGTYRTLELNLTHEKVADC